MNEKLESDVMNQLFTEARTYPGWSAKPVPDSLLYELYDLAKWGPTSMNCQPMRLVFVRSAEAREKLVSALARGNVDKVKTAPVTAIIAHDMSFYANLGSQFPHAPNAADMFLENDALIESTAFRNGSLQGAYLLIAARALGLDTGPMSGFDNDKVDELFFPGEDVKSNFIMTLGYGDAASLHPRGPRLKFDAAASII